MSPELMAEDVNVNIFRHVHGKLYPRPGNHRTHVPGSLGLDMAVQRYASRVKKPPETSQTRYEPLHVPQMLS